MVDEVDKLYEVVLTPDFLEDLEAAVRYVGEELESPGAARQLYIAVREKVEGLAVLPGAAAVRGMTADGRMRYAVSHKRYDIHYVIDGTVVRVTALKHQLQNYR